jgi:serine/threonine-protein kinase ULK/ATG1
MMDLVGPTMTRLVGDYILGPRIGSGSFAVVWRSRHRNSGLVVAIKEIDKTQLSPKVRDNLIKEISILSTIHHPNIIQLFEVIQVCLFFVFFFVFCLMYVCDVFIKVVFVFVF